LQSLLTQPVFTCATADIPGRSGRMSPHDLSIAIFTGTRCTTFVKLPVALSGGRSENREPVAPLMLWTCPVISHPEYASTAICTDCPTFIFETWVSLKFAVTHVPESATMDMSCCAG